MKKLIVMDMEQICGSDLIGSGIWDFGWEAWMYGIWQCACKYKPIVQVGAALFGTIIVMVHLGIPKQPQKPQGYVTPTLLKHINVRTVV